MFFFSLHLLHFGAKVSAICCVLELKSLILHAICGISELKSQYLGAKIAKNARYLQHVGFHPFSYAFQGCLDGVIDFLMIFSDFSMVSKIL